MLETERAPSPEIVAFILRRTPGAVVDVDDVRTVQAAIFWWRGFAGGASFEAYLEAVPSAPARPVGPKYELRLLTLVDPRRGDSVSAALLGQRGKFALADGQLRPFDRRHGIREDRPYWVSADDGSGNLWRPPEDCRQECTGLLHAGILHVGIAIMVQHGRRPHFMDLPGSVLVQDARSSAYVGVWNEEITIGAHDDSVPSGNYGSVKFILEGT
ncbi:MAG: hypothetical protein AAB839_02635 [Patescibacteria group bacterium]